MAVGSVPYIVHLCSLPYRALFALTCTRIGLDSLSLGADEDRLFRFPDCRSERKKPQFQYLTTYFRDHTRPKNHDWKIIWHLTDQILYTTYQDGWTARWSNSKCSFGSSRDRSGGPTAVEADCSSPSREKGSNHREHRQLIKQAAVFGATVAPKAAAAE